MSSDQSDWKENMQDKLQEIKGKRQNGGPGDTPGADKEQQDADIGFLQEEIKKRPLNRKKMMRRMTIVAVMAAIFGAVACLFFLLLEPIFNRILYPQEAVTGVSYPEETETEELTPEEMIVNEEEKAATEEQERIRMEVERFLRDKDQGAEAAARIYSSLRQVAAEARYFLVDVSEISSDTDWFNDPYETRGVVSGMIIAKAESEIQVLVYSPGIGDAETIQVTFYDGSSVEASIRSQDRVSGLAVLSVSLDNLDATVKEQIRAADLGSSAPSTLTGQLVLAVGRPIGTGGSISYGAVSSASANLGTVDSGLMQITIGLPSEPGRTGRRDPRSLPRKAGPA